MFLEYDEIIPSLLKAGADLNMQDNKGKTLLHDTAIYSSGYEDLGYLLDAKADPNIQDEKVTHLYTIMLLSVVIKAEKLWICS